MISYQAYIYKFVFVKNIILCCFLSSLIGCEKKQTPVIGNKFDNTTSFFVYDIDPRRGRIQIEQIERMTQNIYKEEFNLDLFKRIVGKAKHRNDSVFWKGSYLCIVSLSDGSKIYLAVSVYGSFFEILGEEGWYSFRDNEQVATEWKNETRKISLKFIGERRKIKKGKENGSF